MIIQRLSLTDFSGSDFISFALTGLIAFTLAIILLRIFLFCLSKAFEAICDWLEYKLTTRKTRSVAVISRKKKHQLSQPKTNNTTLKTTQQKTTTLNSTRKGRIIDAQNVLRRNAEAYSNRHKN